MDPKQRKRQKVDLDKESKNRVKSFKLPKEIQWGHYDIYFPTLDNDGIKELCDFLKRLDSLSRYPQTRQDLTFRILHPLLAIRSPYEILKRLTQSSSFPREDVTCLTDGKSLDKALMERFTTPLFYRAAEHPDCRSLRLNTELSLQDFLAELAKDGKEISVYDYSISDPSRRTHTTTVEETLSHFQSNKDCGPARNFLDIENRAEVQFCPAEIARHDIRTKIAKGDVHHVGKVDSTWASRRPSE
jgi:hypothetical protein